MALSRSSIGLSGALPRHSWSGMLRRCGAKGSVQTQLASIRVWHSSRERHRTVGRRTVAGAQVYPSPNVRRLRIYSFDPALAARYDLAGMSGVTIEVPWEDDLKPGPVGEYVEVIDVDTGSNAAYGLIDLYYPALLVTEGSGPSDC